MGEYLDKVTLENKGEEIDQKFKSLLDELRLIPKENRFEWLKKQELYGSFVIELMNAWRPQSYDRLKERLQNEKYVTNTLPQDGGIASTIKYEEDPEVFMNAVKGACEGYTGKNQEGTPYTFLQSVGQIYEQKASIAGGENDFQKLGFATGTNPKDLYKILRLRRNVKKICDDTNNSNAIDRVLEECISKSRKHEYTKNAIELTRRMVEGLDFVNSLDAPLTEENGGVSTFGEQRESPKSGFEEMEKQEIKNALLDFTREDFDEKWKLIIASTDKQNRELIKAFLSKDILIALKLEFVTEDVKKHNMDLLEPKCGQWCQRASRCIYDVDGKGAVSRRTSCYIRYGDNKIGESFGCRYKKDELKISMKHRKKATVLFVERGNREIFEILEQMGMSFYKNILDNEYVKKAYINDVEDYYDLFAEKLKPAKGIHETGNFQFTDAVLGKALGKSKSSVSKYRVTYEKRVRPTLYEIFRKQLE